MNTRHVTLLIEGLVQGVSYRASAHELAQRLGLVGHVRNLPQGHVEAVAEGSREAIEAFIAWCRCGPPEALVSRVTVTDLPPSGHFSSFQVLR
jgi:acylphosphatase